MRFLKLVTAVAAGSFAAASFAQLSSQDRNFMMKAAQGGIFEVSANKVGSGKSRAPRGQTALDDMVMDHSKANAELMNMARRKGVRLPKSTDAKHAKIVSRLRALDGMAFDKYHVQTQIKAHKETIALFKKQAQNGRDAQVKEWARAKIPKLEEHLHMWQRAGSEIGVKG